MFHILYKTTNTVNGKNYVGVHSTSNLDDGYLGSGKQIRAAIKKYGSQVFSREILEYFDSREKAFVRESEIVTEEFINKCDNYNMGIGGLGGNTKTESIKKQISEKLIGRIISDATKKKMSENNGMKKETTKKPNTTPPILRGKDNGMYGKNHTVESISLMSKNRKEARIDYTNELRKSLGDNSRGKKWYNNGTEGKRFVEGDQPDNFILGRISKQTHSISATNIRKEMGLK